MHSFLIDNNPKIVELELSILDKEFIELNKNVKKEVFEQLFAIFENLNINHFPIEKFTHMQNSFKDIIIAYYGKESKNNIDKLSFDLQEGIHLLFLILIDYITQFGPNVDEKIKKSIYEESWKETNVPIVSQEIITFIINLKIDELIGKSVKEIYEVFNQFNDSIMTPENKNDIVAKPLLEINEEAYKIINCLNPWIHFIYDTIKMIALFDISKLDMILQLVYNKLFTIFI